ncbi:MAG: hypothetical protein DRG59_07080 [Deltaproteobacteria bacterium]|nr:MAG: hypothetical protein DRG59_07080 [Deltaproteobacteria bacterium]
MVTVSERNQARIVLIAAFILCIFAKGCGYQFAGQMTELGNQYKSISIPMFTNNTSESTLEKIFTKYFREEFIQNSNLPLVPSREADLIILGKIDGIKTSVVSYREAEETRESRVTIRIKLKCIQTSDNHVVWQGNLSYYEEYFQDPDPIITLQNRQKAIHFIAQYLAEEVHQRLAAKF